MAIKTINIGSIANDGTGDDLREAFKKVNDNFTELDLRDPEKTTASNLGAQGTGVFAQLIDNDLQFKKLVGGPGTSITSDNNTITIQSNAQGLDSFQLFGDSGNLTVSTDGQAININGGQNVSTNISNNGITINADTALSTDNAPTLSANLNANGFEIINASDVKSTVYGVDLRDIDGIQSLTLGFDFQSITGTVTNHLELLALTIDFDLGTILQPSELTLDGGVI